MPGMELLILKTLIEIQLVSKTGQGGADREVNRHGQIILDHVLTHNSEKADRSTLQFLCALQCLRSGLI